MLISRIILCRCLWHHWCQWSETLKRHSI